MNSDSKKESYKAEREACEILNYVMNKKKAIEDLCDSYIDEYPVKITGIASFRYNLSKLPDEIECYFDYADYEDFKFETKWLDINYEEYFKELKTKRLNYKKNLIENVENSLNKHKEEYEKLLNLEYKE